MPTQELNSERLASLSFRHLQGVKKAKGPTHDVYKRYQFLPRRTTSASAKRLFASMDNKLCFDN